MSLQKLCPGLARSYSPGLQLLGKSDGLFCSKGRINISCKSVSESASSEHVSHEIRRAVGQAQATDLHHCRLGQRVV